MRKRWKVLLTIAILVLLTGAVRKLWLDSREPLIAHQSLEVYVPTEMAKEIIALWPARQGSQWGYINRAGEFVIQAQFEGASRFREGVAAVEEDGRVGYIDKTGQFLIKPQFSKEGGRRPFSEGRAGYRDGVTVRPLRFFGLSPQNGYVDIDGNKVIKARFYAVGDFQAGLAWVVQRQWFPRRFKYGFIDRQGSLVIGYHFDEVGPEGFSEGFAAVRQERKWFFIDTTGQAVFAKRFDYAYRFSEGLAAVKVEGRWGFLDQTGQWVVKPFYDAVEAFSEGLAAVRIGRQWGFIDKAGKMQIPLQYHCAREFKEGLAAVHVDEKWGFIEKTGKLVIPPHFDEAASFQNGAALVTIRTEEARRRSAYLDKTGKIFWQEQ